MFSKADLMRSVMHFDRHQIRAFFKVCRQRQILLAVKRFSRFFFKKNLKKNLKKFKNLMISDFQLLISDF